MENQRWQYQTLNLKLKVFRNNWNIRRACSQSMDIKNHLAWIGVIDVVLRTALLGYQWKYQAHLTSEIISIRVIILISVNQAEYGNIPIWIPVNLFKWLEEVYRIKKFRTDQFKTKKCQKFIQLVKLWSSHMIIYKIANFFFEIL